MKKHVTIVLFVIAIALQIQAQKPNKIAVVCVYDYKEAIVTGKNSSIPGCQQPIYYLVGTADSICYEISERKNFSQMIKETCSSKNLLVYVHGDSYNIDGLLKAASILPDLYNTDILLFAWAAEERPTNVIRNYKLARENARQSTSRFAETMDSIKQFASKEGVNCVVLFHSLGNLFAKYHAHHLINNPSPNIGISNFIVNAACVYEEDHYIWLDVLANNVTNKVYVMRNEKDQILQSASTFIESEKLLGRTKITVPSKKAIYIDFTETLKGEANFQTSHSYFYQDIPHKIPTVKSLYNTIIHNEHLDLNDSNRFDKTEISNYLLVK